MLYVLLGLVFSSHFALADDWICKEESSRRDGYSIHACGIGSGADESIARIRAFKSARAEFEEVCHASIGCAGALNANPGRTTCEKKGALFKCYRMVVFDISSNEEIPAPPEMDSVTATIQYGEDDLVPTIVRR